MKHSTLAEWLAWQETLHLSAIDLGLDRIRQVAARLNLLTLPVPLITVGGTNGKGSTCAMLTAVLVSQGYRVGTYTSPHLLHYNERIAINGEPVADAPICAAFAAIDAVRGDISLTYFEFGTLAAVWCFAHAPVDVMVLEVGLGGRLDAVNLWDADVAIITSIGIDHVDWLGDNREVIGREKAGIMRAGKPIICGDPEPPASIAVEAERIGATLYQYGDDFDAHGLPQPALLGAVQAQNAACVAQALRCLANVLPISADNIAQGLTTVRLMGRLQKLHNQPELVVDVAHNPHAATELAKWLRDNQTTHQTHAIFSILADKDIAGVVAIMQPWIQEWHLVPLQGARAVPVETLKNTLQRLGVQAPIRVYQDFHSAWDNVLFSVNKRDRVVAFGSFLVVSGMLEVVVPQLD